MVTFFRKLFGRFTTSHAVADIQKAVSRLKDVEAHHSWLAALHLTTIENATKKKLAAEEEAVKASKIGQKLAELVA